MSGWATASAARSSQASNSSSPLRRTVIPGGVTAVRRARERAAQHVLERLEPVAPVGQQGADRGVGQVGELDLDRGGAGGEGALDLVEGGRVRDAGEAEPRDLVERRVRLGEARDAAGERDHEAAPVVAAVRRPGGQRDELRLRPARCARRGRCRRTGALGRPSSLSPRSRQVVSTVPREGRPAGDCLREPYGSVGSRIRRADPWLASGRACSDHRRCRVRRVPCRRPARRRGARAAPARRAAPAGPRRRSAAGDRARAGPRGRPRRRSAGPTAARRRRGLPPGRDGRAGVDPPTRPTTPRTTTSAPPSCSPRCTPPASVGWCWPRSMVVYGEGRYDCPEHGDSCGPAPRAAGRPRRGRLRAPLPAVRPRPWTRRWSRRTRRSTRAASTPRRKAAQEHSRLGVGAADRRRGVVAALPQRLRAADAAGHALRRRRRRSSAPRSSAVRRRGSSRTAASAATSCTSRTSPRPTCSR